MRSAFVAASVVLLVSSVALADDSPAVPPVAEAPLVAVPSVHTESAAVQELQAAAARVAAALPKAEKAVAAAAKALPERPELQPRTAMAANRPNAGTVEAIT